MAKIYKLCGRCKGTGKAIDKVFKDGQWVEVTIKCPACEGEGYLEWGKIKGKEE